MRKFILFFILLFSVFLFFSFVDFEGNSGNEKKGSFNSENEVRGVFISYIDYGHFNGKSSSEIKSLIDEMINSVSYFGLNSIILQVSPFSDAIYPSKVYKSSHVVVAKEGDDLPMDILDYFISSASKKNIEIYAWFNPYRIRNDNNKGDINKDSYYYKWFDTDNIEVTDKGIYLNPASLEVLEYIKKGISEVCSNYDIKGVLFDDYFYPNETIDLKSYDKTSKNISLDDYRVSNINKLISESYDTVKKVNKNIKFGISPAGNIENNLTKEYLDVKGVLESNKIDFIIPQLYYGFDNSSKPYIGTLNEWNSLNVNNTDLYVGLSLYKSGKVDLYAGDGRTEWVDNNDIIKKQIIVSRNISNYKGFYIFRYEYLFKIHNSDSLDGEISNLKTLIDTR